MTDESGQPVVEAVVQVAGARGAATDSSGRFAFQDLPAEEYRLEITHVAYHPKSVLASPGSPLTIVLTHRSIPLEELGVIARTAGIPNERPSFSLVIPRAAFEGQSITLPEILARTTGVQVRSLGGLGAFSTISVRGSSHEQVDVRLDGISLNAAQGGGVDLSNLPTSHIGLIEIQRGAGQGSGGLGGTVHIRTRAPESSSYDLFTSWGSFDTRAMNAMVGRRSARWRGFLIVDYAASDNDFHFLDDNGTEYNPRDDEITKRRNSDLVSASLLAKSKHTLTDSRSLSVHQTLFWKHQGIPGLSNNQSSDARFDTFRSLSEVVYEDASFLGRTAATQSLYYTHTDGSFSDPLGEVGIGRQDNDDRTQSWGWRSEIRWPWSSGHLFRWSSEVARESYDPTAHIQLITPLFAARRWKLETSGGGDVSLGKVGVWSFRGQIRRLSSRLEGRNPFAFSPQAPDTLQTRTFTGIHSGIRLDLSKTLSLKGNVGRSERAPSLFELFGDRGGVVGNTRLRPERALTWDAGLRYESGAVSVEAVYFDHHYDDLIQFFQTSQATSRPHNIGQARVRGLEFTHTSAREPFTLSTNYTLQDARDRSDIPSQRGNTLPNRPRHELSARGTASLGPFTARYNYAFEDGNFLDPANRRPLSSRHIHGASIGWVVGGRLQASLEGRNLTNTQVHDVWGYPLPGRAWFISLRNAP